jgi:hypothetical protein
LSDGPSGLSLDPSIGNWQRPCRSHYWILDGEVVWSEPWTEEQVRVGRAREEARREAFFASRTGRLRRIWPRIARMVSGK